MVVARGVRGHHQAEPLNARLAQEAHHTALRRSAVEEHRGPVGMLDQGRVALADVEESHGELAGRARSAQQGQTRQAASASTPPAPGAEGAAKPASEPRLLGSRAEPARPARQRRYAASPP